MRVPHCISNHFKTYGKYFSKNWSNLLIFLIKSGQTIYISANVWECPTAFQIISKLMANIFQKIDQISWFFWSNLVKQFISLLMYESAPLRFKSFQNLWQIFFKKLIKYLDFLIKSGQTIYIFANVWECPTAFQIISKLISNIFK